MPSTITPTISLNEPLPVALGDTVTFSVTVPKGIKNPWISLLAYQGDATVYGEGGVPGHAFVLGGASSDWLATGGAAECHAELGDLYFQGGQQHYVKLAETTFHAEG